MEIWVANGASSLPFFLYFIGFQAHIAKYSNETLFRWDVMLWNFNRTSGQRQKNPIEKRKRYLKFPSPQYARKEPSCGTTDPGYWVYNLNYLFDHIEFVFILSWPCSAEDEDGFACHCHKLMFFLFKENFFCSNTIMEYITHSANSDLAFNAQNRSQQAELENWREEEGGGR